MLILTQLGYLLQGILASPIFFFIFLRINSFTKQPYSTHLRDLYGVSQRGTLHGPVIGLLWSPVKDKVYPIFGLGYQVVSVWQMLNYCALIDEQLWHLVTAFYSLLESLLNEHTWCNFCEWSPPIRIILHDFIRYMFAKSPFYSFFLCQYNCVVLCVYLFAWPC